MGNNEVCTYTFSYVIPESKKNIEILMFLKYVLF